MATPFKTRKTIIMLCTSLLISGVFVSAQQTDDNYQPKSGDKGKDVIWVPTSLELAEIMFDLAELTSDDYLIDLGSGDGRMVIGAAKRGAKALGVEFNPKMVELSKQKAIEAGVSDKANFVVGDLFETDFSDVTVITMFLLTSINLKLRPTLLDLKPGTRIVTNTFTMGDWEADDSAAVEDPFADWGTALLWIVPAKVEGTWTLPSGTLSLNQKFQMLTGTLNTGNAAVPIEDGRMRGDRISFNAAGAQYSGLIHNGAIDGEVVSNGTTTKWSAKRN